MIIFLVSAKLKFAFGVKYEQKQFFKQFVNCCKRKSYGTIGYAKLGHIKKQHASEN
jgi:hypothetical protein